MPNGEAQRLVNLMACLARPAPRSAGRMGMREVRRLRGEVGRVIFDEGGGQSLPPPIFKPQPLHNPYRRLPEEDGGEGDMRLDASPASARRSQQARERRPDGKQEFRVARLGWRPSTGCASQWSFPTRWPQSRG